MSDGLVIAESAGTITVPQGVLERIVRLAVNGARDVRVRRPRRRLDVAVEDGRARVSVAVAVRYGTSLPGAAEDAQRRVADALRAMCGLEPAGIDVTVEELDT